MRPLLAVALVNVLAGCGKPSGLEHVGASEARAPRSQTPTASDAGAVAGPSPLPDDFRTRFLKVRAPFVSSGHAAGRWQAQVYANEAGARAIETRSRDVPVGAVVVEDHATTADPPAPGPRFVMEKRPPGYAPEHGDWRYVAFSSSGRIVDDGVIASCAGCHDAAPADGLFPVGP